MKSYGKSADSSFLIFILPTIVDSCSIRNGILSSSSLQISCRQATMCRFNCKLMRLHKREEGKPENYFYSSSTKTSSRYGRRALLEKLFAGVFISFLWSLMENSRKVPFRSFIIHLYHINIYGILCGGTKEFMRENYGFHQFNLHRWLLRSDLNRLSSSSFEYILIASDNDESSFVRHRD